MHPLAREALRLEAEARRHKAAANRHRQAARAAREAQARIEARCRKLGIAIIETGALISTGEGDIHGRPTDPRT